MNDEPKQNRTYDQADYLDGAFFAAKAAEHSKKCTAEQNLLRRENGRRSNVSPVVAILPGHEVAEDFFRSN